jgi:hypothetical protein
MRSGGSKKDSEERRELKDKVIPSTVLSIDNTSKMQRVLILIPEEMREQKQTNPSRIKQDKAPLIANKVQYTRRIDEGATSCCRGPCPNSRLLYVP